MEPFHEFSCHDFTSWHEDPSLHLFSQEDPSHPQQQIGHEALHLILLNQTRSGEENLDEDPNRQISQETQAWNDGNRATHTDMSWRVPYRGFGSLWAQGDPIGSPSLGHPWGKIPSMGKNPIHREKSGQEKKPVPMFNDLSKKKFFLVSNLDLLWHRLRPFPLFLLKKITQKSPP